MENKTKLNVTIGTGMNEWGGGIGMDEKELREGGREWLEYYTGIELSNYRNSGSGKLAATKTYDLGCRRQKEKQVPKSCPLSA